MSDTNQGGKWSISEAANAVKAIFVLEGMSPKGFRALRWTDIRRSLKDQGRPISPRTLARVLDSLEVRKEIVWEKRGKEMWYSLILPTGREETLAAFAMADTMTIQGAVRIGGVGDRDQRWAFYGLPSPLARRLRPRLREAAWRFQEELTAILNAESKRVIRGILAKARGRASRAVIVAGERALSDELESAIVLGYIAAASQYAAAYLDRIAPGAFGTFSAKIEKEFPPSLDKAVKYLARLTGVSEEEALADLRKAEKRAEAIRGLFEALRPADREREGRRFAAVLTAWASLCAVVR